MSRVGLHAVVHHADCMSCRHRDCMLSVQCWKLQAWPEYSMVRSESRLCSRCCCCDLCQLRAAAAPGFVLTDGLKRLLEDDGGSSAPITGTASEGTRAVIAGMLRLVHLSFR
jgi:hypothetical protein